MFIEFTQDLATSLHAETAKFSLKLSILLLQGPDPRVLYTGRAYRYPPYVAFYIYLFSTNISTEYFKHAAHSPFFLFKMQFISQCHLFLVPVLFTFYIQGVLKI
jgi:hypothetical protein